MCCLQMEKAEALVCKAVRQLDSRGSGQSAERLARTIENRRDERMNWSNMVRGYFETTWSGNVHCGSSQWFVFDEVVTFSCLSSVKGWT